MSIDERKINGTIEFLMDSGAALLLLTQEKAIEDALKAVIGDSELRERVCNFYSISNFAEIWLHYTQLTDREKQIIDSNVKKTLRR